MMTGMLVVLAAGLVTGAALGYSVASWRSPVRRDITPKGVDLDRLSPDEIRRVLDD
jgi:hypothetical protein